MPPGVPPLSLFTMLARDERLFERFMGGGLLDRGHLTLRQREIVIDRVTARCGAEYEWGVHVAFFAGKAMLSEAQLASLVHGSADDRCWTDELEKILIRVADDLTDTATIAEDRWRAFAAGFSDEACLEVILLCGFYRTVSCLVNATELPLESFAVRFPARG
ncbi:MAG: carboxymuconolactone decarboxylase family protein [Rhizobiaceae bacterium]